jgi:omega-6 fatty acid desaturase (delta-12 desaturase)
MELYSLEKYSGNSGNRTPARALASLCHVVPGRHGEHESTSGRRALGKGRAASVAAPVPTTRLDARWGTVLREYRQSDAARATRELAMTSIPLLLVACSMFWAVKSGHLWLYALMILPAAGFLVRLFVIQHDCAHYSFFPNRRANAWLGRLIGVATLTPHDHWRRSHAFHHASSGNLARRGIGDVYTLTTCEYLARCRWGRLRYRLYRHPAVMFTLGPLYLFLIHNRLPYGFMTKGWKPWVSTMATNAAIVAMTGLAVAIIGLRPFLWCYVPTVFLAAVAGVWLFYMQHQFESTYWADGKGHNARDAALRGSSHYDLPGVLRWFTGNIGIHHVHHLSSGIPLYRLPEVLRDHGELRNVGRLTLLQSLECLRLALWDENSRRMVSFKQLRRNTAVV